MKDTARAAWRCWWNPFPTTKTGRWPTSAIFSTNTAATWGKTAAWRGCSIKKGGFPVKKADVDEEKLMSVALDAGAEDIRDEDEDYEVITQPEDFEAVKKGIG